MIDLHTHSTCSDGTLSPAALLRAAREAGVTHMALTDHDTVAGLAEAREEAGRQGVVFIGGLEISAEYQPGTMHILGYGFDESSPSLLEKLAFVQQARRDRNPKIVSILNRLGLSVTMEQVADEAGGEVVGRPHFAAVLLRKGHVQSTQEAFDRFLAKGQPAYMDKVRLSPEDSIAAIRAAGGVAVLAHPLQLKVHGDEALETLVSGLAKLGLQGMECHYRNHTEDDTARFLGLARRHNLVPTGGSDFHGANRPRIRLGIGEGKLHVPRECWEGIVTRGLRD
jgi:predicted metal-dependent phosphoesterase TrpH